MAVVYRLQTPLTLLGVWDLRFQRPYKVSERGPIAVLGFCSFQPQSLGIRIWYEQLGGDLAFLHDVPRAFRCSTRGGEQMGAEGDRMEPWCQWKGWSLGIHMATHIGSGQIYADLQKISAIEILVCAEVPRNYFKKSWVLPCIYFRIKFARGTDRA